MNPHLYLAIAGNSVSIPLLVGLGFVVGLLSGLFGVGGGFLMTPLLIMIGIPPTVGAATDSNQIVAASSSGAFAHYRLGNIDIKMGLVLLVGGFIGGTGGVHLVKVLRAMGNADFLIVVTYVLMLGSVGTYMFIDSLRALRGTPEPVAPVHKESGSPSFYVRLIEALPYRTSFPKSGVEMSIFVPFLLGLLVGVLAAIMGVGGGFIMVPVMVYLLRMPMHVVVGTSLFNVLFTCINVTCQQAAANHTVDFLLAVILMIGSVIGAQVGARLSTRLKADQLKIMLAVLVLLVMVKMLFSLLLPPELLLAPRGGH